MRVLVLTVMVLLPLPSLAGEYIPYPATANLPSSPVFSYRLPGDLQGSYNFITNDGMILTAGHNVVGCLNYNKDVRVRLPDLWKYKVISKGDGPVRSHSISGTEDKFSYGEGIEVVETPHEAIHDLKCERNINFQVDQNTYQLLAFGGDGYISFESQNHMRHHYPELLKSALGKQKLNGVAGIGDFALLNLVENPGAPLRGNRLTHHLPVHCLPLSPTGASLGDKVWNLGFPALGGRPGYSPLYQASISGGIVYSKYDHPSYSPANLKAFDDELLYASLDSGPGSSGSAVINSAGEIVGIIVMGVDASVLKQYKRGATVFINSRNIVKHLREKLGDQYVDEKILKGCQLTPEAKELIRIVTQAPTH